jgi:hypothetical protein
MEFSLKSEQPKSKVLRAGKFATAEEAAKFKTDLLMKGLAKIDPSIWEKLRTQ